MNSISRKGFIKGAALGSTTVAGAAAFASIAFANDAVPKDSWEAGIDWSAEYDVIVIGAGFAGLMTAAVAADAGQNVLVLEKAPRAARGGNSRVTAGYYIDYYDGNRDGFVSYCKGVRGLYESPADEMIEAFADAVHRVPGFLNERGSNHITEIEACGPYTWAEGHEAINLVCQDARSEEDRASNTGMFVYNGGMYNALINHIETLDNVDVWYGCPAESLIQDPVTKIVHGAAVDHDGEIINIRALDGISLCAGGFAANQTMVQDYLRYPYAVPLGNTYGTGDGVKMGIGVGADLWHMCATDGPDFNVPNPETGMACTGGSIRFRGSDSPDPSQPGDVHESSMFTLHNAIIVGADATRFCDEATLPNHGFEDYHGRLTYVMMSLPAWIVFDKNAFEYPIYPVWQDNREYVDKGIIIEADTLEELAEKTGLPAEGLAQTVSTYNQYCASGNDPDFNRDATYLLPLDEDGPFYAAAVAPSIVNTQGGPKRNALAQIVDVNNEPIPHLYGAGECGSMWADVYPGGGNIGEALAFGLIAGEQLSVKAQDNYRGSLLDKEPVDFTDEPATFVAESTNEFIGCADGMGGPIWVKVVVNEKSIDSIEVLHSFETPGIGSKAIDSLPAAMLEAQGTHVDSFTGATATSEALKAAVNEALALAGLTA